MALAMKWIRTTHGSHAHAILRAGDETTICGIHLVEHANAIITLGPGELDRCANCDNEWRRLGRAGKPKKRKTAAYVERFTFRDWEDL
jgi:hypothetical protein